MENKKELTAEQLSKISGGDVYPLNDSEGALVDQGTCPYCGAQLQKVYWWEAGHQTKNWSMNCPNGHVFCMDINTKKWFRF